jgi:hypothetical protein
MKENLPAHHYPAKRAQLGPRQVPRVPDTGKPQDGLEPPAAPIPIGQADTPTSAPGCKPVGPEK